MAKPCAKCRHTKTLHRRHECRKTWQGVLVVTKRCLCDGYLDQADRTADGGETHA